MIRVKRGEVWLLDLGLPKDDHEQAGRRPAVILQTDDLSDLSTVVIVPLTTQSKRAGFAQTFGFPQRKLVRTATRWRCAIRFGRSIAAS